MIDFACQQFDLDDIIKCGLGLTKAEYRVLRYFLKNPDRELTTISIARAVKLNLTTVQKAVKKISEQQVIIKRQKNLESGGYVYLYVCNSRSAIRGILKRIIREWVENVERGIDLW